MEKVHDKTFKPYINSSKIIERTKELADKINADYEGREPVFLGILNGSFIFAGELFKHINLNCSITFVKLASYKGTTSTGNIVTAIGLEEILTNKDVIIIEDIVDTGQTMHHFLKTLKEREAASASICTLLRKPDAVQFDLPIDYIGFDIPDKFVVGYGLDYDGYGRNIDGIYQLED